MTRDEKLDKFVHNIVQGGYSSIYHFIDTHVEDWELDEEE